MKEGNNDRIKKATKEWRKDESKEQGKQWRNEGMEEAINAERTEEYGFSKEWNSYTTTRNWELLFFVKRELIAFYISRLAPIFDHLLTFPMVFFLRSSASHVSWNSRLSLLSKHSISVVDSIWKEEEHLHNTEESFQRRKTSRTMYQNIDQVLR